MDFSGPRNHIRLVSGRLWGRRERGKEGMQMEAKNREKRKGGVGLHIQRRKGMMGGERQRETVEEMVGGETSVKV